MTKETPSPFSFGDSVTWDYVPRGGYGYVCPAFAYVVKVTAQRVGIAVASAYGDEWLPRWVRPESLRPRKAQ